MHIKTLGGFARALSDLRSRARVIWAQKGLVNDAWMERVYVTALSGADWQGKPNASV